MPTPIPISQETALHLLDVGAPVFWLPRGTAFDQRVHDVSKSVKEDADDWVNGNRDVHEARRDTEYQWYAVVDSE